MKTKWMCVTFAAVTLLVSACSGGGSEPLQGLTPAPAEPSRTVNVPTAKSGLYGRFIVGYQGWFGCPGDFDGNAHWEHWFHGAPGADTLLVDMLPATEALPATDLCDTGLTGRDGTAVRVFSSQNPNVVDHHFKLLSQRGVGAVALQRFVVEIEDHQRKRRRDNVLQHVMAAAARHEVPFFLSYDVTGANPATVIQTVRDDWRQLTQSLKLTEHAQYLADGGKPVLQLWGFGVIGNHPGEPDEVYKLLKDLKGGHNGLTAATTIGGVAGAWRTLDGDSKTDSAWTQVYLSFDVLSPWTVGRYTDENSASAYLEQRMAADQALVKKHDIRYLPVIFPGFSWLNLMRVRGQSDIAVVNQIPRNCGNFLWQQAHLVRNTGIDMAYGAMADEFDEATAMLPAQPLKDAFPSNIEGVYLNQDGCKLQADWYMEVLGRISAHFRDGTVPALPLVVR